MTMSSNPTHGYNTSVGYTFGFYREMAPGWLDLCVQAAGYEAPRRDGSFRYLELGCGQGFGLCLLAAANSGSEFVGVDIQPDHIAHARQLAESAGLTNVGFVEADFADLAERWPDDLGTFDYVTLHGILTWVSPKLRQAAADCVGHATHAGSLVYAGYNSQPSWLGMVPFQHFMKLFQKESGKPVNAAIEDSVSLFERLRAGNAPGFQVLPVLDARLQTMRSHSASYLSHEYLNDYWQPLWHTEVADIFAQAGLQFAGSATISDSLLPDALSPQLRDLIAGQEDGGLRQDVQDFAINQGFRRDIFCRGELKPLRGGFPADDARFVLVTQPEAGTELPVPTSYDRLSLPYRDVAPIVQALGNGPRSGEELASVAGLVDKEFRRLIILLIQAGVVAVMADQPGNPDAANRLNAAIARAACDRGPYEQLAAAQIGSAIGASQIELMLLDSWLEVSDRTDAKAVGDGVWDRMTRIGQKLYHQGQQVDDAIARDQLQDVAAAFLRDNLPRWRQLGVVE